MSSVFPLATFIDPLVKDQIRMAREKIVGYVGRIICRTTFADDLVVFAIFLAVRPSLQEFFLSQGMVQNRYLPMAYQFWMLYSEWDRNPSLP